MNYLKIASDTEFAIVGSSVVVNEQYLKRFFCQIDSRIFDAFAEYSDVTGAVVCGYDVIKRGSESQIIGDLITEGVTKYVSLADVLAVAKSYSTFGRKLIKTNGLGNFFLLINKENNPCQVSINSLNGGLSITYYHPSKSMYSNHPIWNQGRRIFASPSGQLRK